LNIFFFYFYFDHFETSDFNLIEISPDYKIDKKWLKYYLEQLYVLLSQTKNKNTEEKQISDMNIFEDLFQIKEQSLKEQENESKNVKIQSHSASKKQEVIYKKVEIELYELFESSPQPYWLNLILIENCRDYSANRFNSIACLIAKSFEKWALSKKNSQPAVISDELKIHAFISSTRHHLLMIDSIAKSYELWQNNQILEPYLKRKVKVLDSKDKAILIGSVMMHDYFNFEEVKSFWLFCFFSFSNSVFLLDRFYFLYFCKTK
jgi:hypothetical protein